jgi:hypothetical protein
MPKRGAIPYTDGNGRPALATFQGLIRNEPTPSPDDHSETAQIIRIAQTELGALTDFTWEQHYQTLQISLMATLIDTLNEKLRRGLTPRPLLRDLDHIQYPELQPFIYFARTGLQRQIQWAYCAEHTHIMETLNLANSEMSAEELDALVKKTGVWMVKLGNQ